MAFSKDQFALAIDHEPLSASHYFSFLSKRSGRRMPPAKRSALYSLYIYVCPTCCDGERVLFTNEIKHKSYGVTGRCPLGGCRYVGAD